MIQFQYNDDLVRQLMDSTGVRTGSGAFKFAADKFQKHSEMIDKQADRIIEQKREIRRLRSIIEKAASSSAQLLEVVGQGDIFND